METIAVILIVSTAGLLILRSFVRTLQSGKNPRPNKIDVIKNSSQKGKGVKILS